MDPEGGNPTHISELQQEWRNSEGRVAVSERRARPSKTEVTKDKLAVGAGPLETLAELNRRLLQDRNPSPCSLFSAAWIVRPGMQIADVCPRLGLGAWGCCPAGLGPWRPRSRPGQVLWDSGLGWHLYLPISQDQLCVILWQKWHLFIAPLCLDAVCNRDTSWLYRCLSHGGVRVLPVVQEKWVSDSCFPRLRPGPWEELALFFLSSSLLCTELQARHWTTLLYLSVSITALSRDEMRGPLGAAYCRARHSPVPCCYGWWENSPPVRKLPAFLDRWGQKKPWMK